MHRPVPQRRLRGADHLHPGSAGSTPSHSREDLAKVEWRALLGCLPSPPPVLVPTMPSSDLLGPETHGSPWSKRRAMSRSRPSTPLPPVHRLPDELLVAIFSLLDVRSLCAARRVCKAWRTCSSDPVLWYRQYARAFGDTDAETPRELLRHAHTASMRSFEWDRAFAEQYLDDRRVAQNWMMGVGRCAEYVQFQSFVRSFSFRRDQIAVGFFDGTVCAYKFGSGAVRVFRESHLDQVVAIDLDDDVIVSGSGPPFWLDRVSVDNSVRVWDARTDQCLRVCTGHTSGIVAVKLTREFLASASRDTTVCIWSRHNNYSLLHRLEGHQATITALQWVRQGAHAAPLLLSSSHDGTIRLWDPWTGACLSVFGFEQTQTASRSVRSMHYYAGQLLVGYMSGRVVLYDLDTARRELRHVREYLKAGLAETRPALSVYFDHDKVAILSGDQVVRVMAYASARPVFNMFGLTIFASTLQADRTRLISDGRNFIIDVHDFSSASPPHDDPLIQIFR